MRIVWDEYKRLVNIEWHGMDFADLDEAFFERSTIASAKLDRMIAVGELFNGVIVVVFLKFGTEGVSVISMRPASRRERRLIDE
ncbi:BrnT family toxin [Rhodopseudomonas palustris]|uniref:BrnT family toxin n=1 Tax=Rhodopseudomonas palustris TaxID=1076 RepID=UPI000641A1C8|nr:BrnT family toxin [Rhodopseudomonas palustris]